MNKRTIDLGAILRKAIEASLFGALVDVVLPVRHQLAQVGAVDTVRPVFVAELRGRASVYEARTKSKDSALRDIDIKRSYIHVGSREISLTECCGSRSTTTLDDEYGT